MFHEAIMLIDQKSTWTEKFTLMELVLHGISHQWFGNLVTPKTWDHWWLSEGLAGWMTYYAYKGTEQDEDCKDWTWFVDGDGTLQKALENDASRDGHALEWHMNDPKKVFDHLSYWKGACVVRMLWQALGEETFFERMRQYLKDNSYQSVTTSTFLKALVPETAGGLSVS